MVTCVLSSDDHLAALDQITLTLKKEVERPAHSPTQILKLGAQTAELFGQKVSQGMEVSNEPDQTDLISIKNFLCVPFLLDHPMEKEELEKTTL